MVDFEKIKLTELNPASYNPRKIKQEELEILEESMENFGLADPIVINLKDAMNRIISGHQRYDVLLNQYMDDKIEDEDLNLIRLGDIGWVFREVDMSIDTEDDEKILNIGMNKISGEFDNKKLNQILDDLELKGLNVNLTGFTDVELKKQDIELKPLSSTKPEVEKDPNENITKIATCPNCGHEFEV